MSVEALDMSPNLGDEDQKFLGIVEAEFQLPFGAEGDLFTALPLEAANGKPDGSIFPTVTDGNDRQGDKD